jgi:hypothetical protein
MLSLLGTGASCDLRVLVSGAESVQSSRMGVYTQVDMLRMGGRPYYQKGSTTTVSYLYYSSSDPGWRIGSSLSAAAAGLKNLLSGGAACPNSASGWVVMVNGTWSSVDAYAVSIVTALASPAPTIVPSLAPSMAQTDIPTDAPQTDVPTIGPTRAPTRQMFGMPNTAKRACPVSMVVCAPLLCTHTTPAQMRPCPSCMATRPRSVRVEACARSEALLSLPR